MRYVLYLFTLILVFVSGMLVANVYLPTRNSSIAAAISVPEPAQNIPQLEEISLQQATRNLDTLKQALNSCPVIVAEEKDRLLAEINLLLARQDFDIKKALFELEIAKNTPGTSVTPQFAKASADYAASLKNLETLALQLYPPQPKEPPEAENTGSEPNSAAEASSQAENEAAPAAKPAETDTPKDTAPDNKPSAAGETKPDAAPAAQPATPSQPDKAAAKTPETPKEQTSSPQTPDASQAD